MRGTRLAPPGAVGRLPVAILLLAGCLLAARDWPAVKAEIRHRHPQVTQLSTAELAAWMARPDAVQPLLLDVRAPAEYAVSHLRGAARAETLPEALDLLATAPSDTPIVLYCSVGYRSAGLAERLHRAGFTGVRNLEGSIFQWANEGRPVYRGGGEVRQVHPYGEPWAGLLDPSLRVDPSATAWQEIQP